MPENRSFSVQKVLRKSQNAVPLAVPEERHKITPVIPAITGRLDPGNRGHLLEMFFQPGTREQAYIQ